MGRKSMIVNKPEKAGSWAPATGRRSGFTAPHLTRPRTLDGAYLFFEQSLMRRGAPGDA